MNGPWVLGTGISEAAGAGGHAGRCLHVCAGTDARHGSGTSSFGCNKATDASEDAHQLIFAGHAVCLIPTYFGCCAHARRHFLKAHDSKPGEGSRQSALHVEHLRGHRDAAEFLHCCDDGRASGSGQCLPRRWLPVPRMESLTRCGASALRRFGASALVLIELSLSPWVFLGRLGRPMFAILLPSMASRRDCQGYWWQAAPCLC